MLKKIHVEQLRVGMYLKSFCGAWIDHPFWRNSFVLRDPEDIRAIRASCITEVWIDAGKGLDVEAGEAAISETESEALVAEEQVREAQAARSLERTSTAVEMQRAAKICNSAKKAVVSMFQEARMGKAVDAEQAQVLVEEIADSVARNPGALMVALARQLGLDEQQTRLAGLSGLLHDMGKAFIPAEILNKPGKLTDEEFVVIKTHPAEGHKVLLEGKGVPPEALDVCLHHHEKMNGGGYPKGLKGDEISLLAKMGAVCDVYDAITSNRPYKAGWDPAESIKKMAEWADGHFDPRVFQAFVKSLGIYPIGSFVRLESGRLGVVVEQSEKSLLAPRVKVFFSTKSNAHIAPELLDLSRPGVHDKIAGREDPAKWGIGNVDEIWSTAAA